ncbi:hypothetical protein FRC20_002364 [Serendipita sp. 405]|nr:hypothetical protein FRC15_002213 [Serendipita sp. 397]KAG8785305.1 hypothetical protein FRC16_001962 [Serendipita sp. 398]KAG8849201.1 hypothetical protein FRC20_002364 [Serendipita sp. 405]
MAKRSYGCKKCNRSFGAAKDLACHIRDSPNHRGAKPTPSKKAQKITWPCKKCGKSFASQSAMQQHIKSPFHAQKSAHCPHCQKKFKTASGVAHHLEHHFGNCRVSNVVRQWDTSGLISTQSYTSYTPTARIEAVSDLESSGSNSKHGSLALVKSQRPQQQQQQQKQQQQIKVLATIATEKAWNHRLGAYLCPFPSCGRIYASLDSLNSHLRSPCHREGGAKFFCPKCQRKFFIVSALIQHVESGACGLSTYQGVKQVYSGLHDTFKRLLKC